jgi:hypothetical protein
MWELTFEGRVLSRGSKEAMQLDRKRTADFSGRDISAYKIVQVY